LIAILVWNRTMAKNKSTFDGPWKHILDLYFEQFIAYCWPSKYAEIDWSKGYKMLDKELTKITRKSKTGQKVVDKLVEIYLKNGDATCLFLHIEIDGGSKASLPERMFTYNTRLRDRYKKPIASLAILIDGNKNFRPNTYKEAIWGTSIEMHFPIIKILDYQDRIPELNASSNPFAQVILAQLAAIKKEQPLARLDTKILLIKQLYKKGWKKENLFALLEFIDWILALPPELELQCTEIIDKIEEQAKMAYVTSFERVGIQKGKLLGESELLVNLLTTKFQSVPALYLEKIKQAPRDTLTSWARKLLFAPKIEDVFTDEDTRVTS
jgi:hypothetical protein